MANNPAMANKLTSQSVISFSQTAMTLQSLTCIVTMMMKSLGDVLMTQSKLFDNLQQ